MIESGEPGFFRRLFNKRILDAIDTVGRREKGEGQRVAAFEQSAGFGEASPAFLVDQPAHRIAPLAFRIVRRRFASRLEIERPTGTETLQCIVDA